MGSNFILKLADRITSYMSNHSKRRQLSLDKILLYSRAIAQQPTCYTLHYFMVISIVEESDVFRDHRE